MSDEMTTDNTPAGSYGLHDGVPKLALGNEEFVDSKDMAVTLFEFAERTRMKILLFLGKHGDQREKNPSVTQIVIHVNKGAATDDRVSQQSVSMHLRRLRRAGLVDYRRYINENRYYVQNRESLHALFAALATCFGNPTAETI